MSTIIAYPHIEKQAGEPAHLRRTPRVRVAQIAMDHLVHGWSADEIVRQHPHLSLGEVHAALSYFFDHQTEIEAEIRSELQQIQSGGDPEESPFLLRMRTKGLL